MMDEYEWDSLEAAARAWWERQEAQCQTIDLSECGDGNVVMAIRMLEEELAGVA